MTCASIIIHWHHLILAVRGVYVKYLLETSSRRRYRRHINTLSFSYEYTMLCKHVNDEEFHIQHALSMFDHSFFMYTGINRILYHRMRICHVYDPNQVFEVHCGWLRLSTTIIVNRFLISMQRLVSTGNGHHCITWTQFVLGAPRHVMNHVQHPPKPTTSIRI